MCCAVSSVDFFAPVVFVPLTAPVSIREVSVTDDDCAACTTVTSEPLRESVQGYEQGAPQSLALHDTWKEQRPALRKADRTDQVQIMFFRRFVRAACCSCYMISHERS